MHIAEGKFLTLGGRRTTSIGVWMEVDTKSAFIITGDYRRKHSAPLTRLAAQPSRSEKYEVTRKLTLSFRIQAQSNHSTLALFVRVWKSHQRRRWRRYSLLPPTDGVAGAFVYYTFDIPTSHRTPSGHLSVQKDLMYGAMKVHVAKEARNTFAEKNDNW